MDRTRASRVLLDGRLQSLLSSSGDVDLGSVGLEGLGDHEADASATASNDGGDVGDIEESTGGELVVLLLSCFGCQVPISRAGTVNDGDIPVAIVAFGTIVSGLSGLIALLMVAGAFLEKSLSIAAAAVLKDEMSLLYGFPAHLDGCM